MKFNKIIKQIIITTIVLLINTSILVATVKKDLKNTTPSSIEESNDKSAELINKLISTNLKTPSTTVQDAQNATLPKSNTVSKTPHIPEEEMPDSFKTGFYILMSAGVIGLCFIVYRAFKLRLSRAERRYGVQGDRSAQELTPLPIAIDEDSDNEDQTIFELNRS